MARRYLGYGTTNSQGIATLDHDPDGNTITGYTGVGAGLVDIIATSGTLQSETYTLEDDILVDVATTGKKNSTGWWNYGNRLTIGTPDDEGTTLTMESNQYGYYYMYPNGTTTVTDQTSYIYNNIGFEFDIVDVGETISNNGVIFYDGTSQQVVGFQWMNASDGDHIEVTYDGSKIVVKVNGVTKITHPKELGTFRCALTVSPNDAIKYKNFKSYPI